MPVSPIPPTDVLLDDRKRLEQPLLAAVWVGIVSISLIERTAFYFLTGTFAVAVNLLAIRHGKEIYVRRWFVNASVGLATCIPVVEFALMGINLITALGHYLILIQICKLFERSRNRDYVQVLALSALVMVSAALRCDALWFAGLLLIYLALVCYTGMVFTLKRGLDSAVHARLGNEAAPMAPGRVAWNVIRHWPGKSLRKGLAVGVGTAVLAGIVVFVVAPRGRVTAAPSLGGMSGRASTGIGESVQLGDARRIYESDRVVMRLKGQGVLPGGYLRGQVFYRYQNSQWALTDRPSANRSLVRPSTAVLRQARVLTVSMESALLPVLFVPPDAFHVDCEEGTVLVGETGLLLQGRSPSRGPVRYRAYMTERPGLLARGRYRMSLGFQTASELLSLWQERVEVRPRVVELAREWTQDLRAQRDRDPANRSLWDLRIARRLADRLRERCTYTLDLPAVQPGRDGVEAFLFETRRGHCEYFASAHVVMCRALGIPARLATGFRIGLSTPGVEGYLVRERDAHAWTEIYSPSAGWVIVDATGSAANGDSDTRWATLQGFWESAKFTWYEHVVGYDAPARARLVRRAAALLSTSWDLAGKATRAVGAGFMNLLMRGHVDRALKRLAVGVALVALVAEGLLLARMVRRHLRARAASATGLPGSPDEVRFMRRLLSLAHRRGAPLRPETTLHQWAAVAADRLQQPAEAIERLVDLYDRARWGREALRPAEVREADRWVRHLGRTLKRSRSAAKSAGP